MVETMQQLSSTTSFEDLQLAARSIVDVVGYVLSVSTFSFHLVTQWPVKQSLTNIYFILFIISLLHCDRFSKSFFTDAVKRKFSRKLSFELPPRLTHALPCLILFFVKLHRPQLSNGKLSVHELKKM